MRWLTQLVTSYPVAFHGRGESRPANWKGAEEEAGRPVGRPVVLAAEGEAVRPEVFLVGQPNPFI